MAPSLYERVGGENAVMATAGLLYQKLLGDPRLSPFFDGVDMTVQVKKMTGFMMWALGGPHAEFRPLRQAHARLVKEKGLSGAHFDLVAGHLTDALTELGRGKAPDRRDHRRRRDDPRRGARALRSRCRYRSTASRCGTSRTLPSRR